MTDLDSLLAGLSALGGLGASPRLVGVGWATVDIERTVAGLKGVDLWPASPDELLGARAWRTKSGFVALVLLEPNTEGRLAAALARRGEGIVALYLRSGEPLEPLDGPVRQTGMGVPGRLVPDARSWGPFLILLAEPA
jgi:hypothetical protein